MPFPHGVAAIIGVFCSPGNDTGTHLYVHGATVSIRLWHLLLISSLQVQSSFRACQEPG